MASPRSPHLVLVGLPGAGKTSVAAGVAERLGRRWLDFDREIERREGRSVARLFAERGEAYFRSLELALTRELAESGGMVLAPGGGWVTIPGAVALLCPPGRMIYLRTTPDVALRRMGGGRLDRPLLRAADPLAELQRLLRAREPAYLAAEHVVDVDILDLQQVIDIVARLAEPHRGD